jgi:hypothetical protein
LPKKPCGANCGPASNGRNRPSSSAALPIVCPRPWFPNALPIALPSGGADLSEQIAEEALRGKLRTCLERQEASQLSGGTADCLAKTLVSKRATDRASKRGTDLSEQIAKEALRRKLLSCQKPDRLRHHCRSVHLRIHISSPPSP